MGMKILIEIFFSLNIYSRTRGYGVTLVKDEEVLVLTEDNKLMEKIIIYRLCNC